MPLRPYLLVFAVIASVSPALSAPPGGGKGAEQSNANSNAGGNKSPGMSGNRDGNGPAQPSPNGNGNADGNSKGQINASTTPGNTPSAADEMPLPPDLARSLNANTLTRQQAADAVAAGQIMSLAAIVQPLLAPTGARMIDARLFRVGDRLLYAIKILAIDGKLFIQYHDARTGRRVAVR